MSNRRHVTAAMLCVVVLLSLLLSSAFIARELSHHHACTGEDCPVCRFIAQIDQLRRGFCIALLALLLVRLARNAGRTWRAHTASMGIPALCTPVGQKTRLND